MVRGLAKQSWQRKDYLSLKKQMQAFSMKSVGLAHDSRTVIPACFSGPAIRSGHQSNIAIDKKTRSQLSVSCAFLYESLIETLSVAAKE